MNGIAPVKTTNELAAMLVDKLFNAPGSFSVTLTKVGDSVEIIAGRRKDFMTTRDVASEFGVTAQTIYRRYINTGKLKRTRHGFRREDVEAIKKEQA